MDLYPIHKNTVLVTNFSLCSNYRPKTTVYLLLFRDITSIALR